MSIENNCNFIGNFVADPDGQDVSDGKGGNVRLVKFKLGVNNRRTGKSTFPQCEVWGKAAELIEEYCKRGDLIAIEAELITDTWKDKETDETRWREKYKVTDFRFLGGRSRPEVDEEEGEEEEVEEKPARKTATATATKTKAKAKAKGKTSEDEDDDDIPF